MLVDGNALMHRAYHGVNKSFTPMWNDMPVGMVYGFGSMMINAIDYFHPDLLVVTFDTKEKTFRHEADAAYKAQRSKAPDDFYPQLPLIDEMLAAFEIPTIKCPGYESDDIIGTLVKKSGDPSTTLGTGFFDVKILSGDLDFTQLLDDRVKLVKFAGKLDVSPIYGRAETIARYGVTPEQMVDFKAITGDSSDNYKGIEGVGPKTAATLMQKFHSLDGIYEHLEEIASEKIRGKFQTQKEYVYHCQYLAQIHLDVPVEFDFEQAFDFAPERTLAFFEKMNFQALIGRYQRLVHNYESGGGVAKPKAPVEEQQLSLF